MQEIGLDPSMEFRVRNIPEQAWQEFKILCIREKTYPNTKIIELIQQAVAKGKPKG